MRKVRIVLGRMLYVFCSRMPKSHTLVIGKCAKWTRMVCGKLILEKCGKNVNIERKAVFSSSVWLGNNSGIGVMASLGGKVIIGDNVMMGSCCTIYSCNHAFDRLDIPMKNQGYQNEKPVVIGNDVWIGGHVIILPGVHIADGTVVGAGAVVTRMFQNLRLLVVTPQKLFVIEPIIRILE